ncbi:MAG: AMP-binding protein [Dehalococcoidia bacterium]
MVAANERGAAKVSETLIDLLAGAVRRYGERVALRGPEGRGFLDVSYVELDRRTAAVRDRIAEHVGPGDFVPLCAHNSNAWIVAFFGIVRRGAVPVPLNPDAPSELLHAVLDELKPKLVLGDARSLRELGRGGATAIDIERDLEGGDARPAVEDAAPAPDDLALLVYTTGTSGVPKAVMLSHRNLTSNVRAILEVADLEDGDVVLVVLPLYHAFPLTTGMLSGLEGGVRIELEARPTRLATRVTEARPTHLLGVPALFELLIDRIERRASSPFQRRYFQAARWLNEQLIRRLGINAGRTLFRPLQQAMGGRLRLAVSGGAPLSPRTQRAAHVLGLPLIQGYGMSEASPVIAAQRWNSKQFWRSRYFWDHAGSCGPPVPGVRIDIEPVEGADTGVGEIVVSGPNVMLGYYQREDETRALLHDGRLHTHDLGLIEDDGELWIRGRLGLAVSTPRGKIVHLERLEDAISHVPGVEQVAVVVEREPSWRLVALVYPSAEADRAGTTAEFVEATLRASCVAACRTLEPHERIDGVRLTDEPLPSTALGKVRRGELPSEVSFELDRWRETLAARAAAAAAEA